MRLGARMEFRMGNRPRRVWSAAVLLGWLVFAGLTAEAGAGPSFDRLVWLDGVTKKLALGPRPQCIGPLGCSAEIPVDSPCRKPAKPEPEVVVDSVVPGATPDTWVVGYRLNCSACYVGGKAYLALVRVRGNNAQIVHKEALRRGRKGAFPEPLDLSSEDLDGDGISEVVCRYRYSIEKKHKCTGMREAGSFLLIAKPKGGEIKPLFHERLTDPLSRKKRAVTVDVRFVDETGDGYADLVVTRNTAGKRTLTTRTVRRYDPDTEDWSGDPITGHAQVGLEEADCDVPLPEKPFVVVARLYRGDKMTDEMARHAAALRKAGFSGACSYRGADFEGLSDKHWVTVVSAHATRSEAEERARAVRASGFTPYVKELFTQ